MAHFGLHLKPCGRACGVSMRMPQRTSYVTRSSVHRRPRLLPTGRRYPCTMCQQAGNAPTSPLSTIAASKPLDRIRSQAKLVFDHYDQDRDGLLTSAELASYSSNVDSRPFGDDLHVALKPLLSQVTNQRGPDATYDFEQFEWLYRQQAELVQRYARVYLAAYLDQAEIEKTKFAATLKDDELAAAHWAFKSLDFGNSGEVPVSMLQRAPGIEGEILQAKVLEDVEGPSVSFSDYIKSYAKPKPVFLNMAILVAHTAVMWAILQAPVELMMKGVMVAVVFIRPQIVTNAVIHLYNIVTVIVNNVRANLEVDNSGKTRFA